MPAYLSARATSQQRLRGGYHVLHMTTEGGSLAQAVPVPGQFVMVRGEWGRDLINPRAFSILDWQDDGAAQTCAIMFKVYGRGTAELAKTVVGQRLWLTAPLGRGFPTYEELAGFQRVFLVAGGVGLPPFCYYAKLAAAAQDASRLQLFYGGRNTDDLVLLEEFTRRKVSMELATEDGSSGARGFVTPPLVAALQRAQTQNEKVAILACGPTPMLQAVRKIGLATNVATWLCVEEQMACGFGACLGCAIPVHGEKPYAYCCSDGPVFRAEQLRWS